MHVRGRLTIMESVGRIERDELSAVSQSLTPAKATRRAARFAMATLLVLEAVCPAEATPPSTDPAWRTGTRFHRQLQVPVGLMWRQTPLETALHDLAHSQRTAIFLDRRVDPSQMIDFAVHEVPLEKAVAQLAAERGLGVSQVGPVIYLGPVEVAGKLATLVEALNDQIARQPPAIRKIWRRPSPWRWPDLAQPRQLLEDLSGQSGIKIGGIDQVPHDLWRATHLPPLTLAERLVLVAAGFNLTVEMSGDGRSVQLVPIPDRVAIGRRFEVSGPASKVLASLSARFPSCRIEARGSSLFVDGTIEQLQSIGDFLNRQPSPASGNHQRGERYSLRVVNEPADALLRSLASRLSLTIDVDPDATRQLEQKVTVQVTDASLAALLDAALGPLGLSHEIRGRAVHVRKRQVDPK